MSRGCSVQCIVFCILLGVLGVLGHKLRQENHAMRAGSRQDLQRLQQRLKANIVSEVSKASTSVKRQVNNQRPASQVARKFSRPTEYEEDGEDDEEDEDEVYYYLFSYYSSDTCEDNSLAARLYYGTNICVDFDTNSTLVGQSMKYSYDEEENSLSQIFYLEHNCEHQYLVELLYQFDGIEENECFQKTTYEITEDGFELPNADGLYASESASSEECNDEMPFEAYWHRVGSTVTDDYELLDDYDDEMMDDITVKFLNGSIAFEMTCEEEFYLADDDSVQEHNVTTYITVGQTEHEEDDDDDHKRCFAGSETVQLESGETFLVSNVVVGDVILAADSTGNTKYSPVIAVPHARNSQAASFTRLQVASGKDIMLTEEHLLMVSPSCDSTTAALRSAGEVQVGMCLKTADGHWDSVSGVAQNVKGHGLYTVVTMEEYVVVNGIVASPFAVNHAVANAYYSVVRVVAAWVHPRVMDMSVMKKANVLFDGLVSAIF